MLLLDQSYGGFLEDIDLLALRVSLIFAETIRWSDRTPSNVLYTLQFFTLFLHFLLIRM